MTTEGFKQKLTAFLSDDTVGYSSLMVHKVQRLKTHRELLRFRVRDYNGQMIDSPCDNLLCDFFIALNPSRRAVEIQSALKNRNADLPAIRRMKYRINIKVM